MCPFPREALRAGGQFHLLLRPASVAGKRERRWTPTHKVTVCCEPGPSPAICLDF